MGQNYYETMGIELIPRDNLLDAIDTVFDGSTRLIGIEGEEGIGKTTLLVQFAKKYPNNAISLFIKPTNRWGYDPEILRLDLCNQLHWVLKNEEVEPESVDDAFLRNCVWKLSRHARLNRETYYFLIDGLDGLPNDSLRIREMVLDMLPPLGSPNCRFLFTGDYNILPENKCKGVICKSFPIPGFTLGESSIFLKDFNIDRDSLEEIHRSCKGIPGRLASVKRILESGTDINSLINELPDKLPGLFEIEWRKQVKSEIQHKILAVLAHDLNRKHTLSDLSQLFCLEMSEIEDFLKKCSFISISSENNGVVSFVSESFRKFAADQLSNLQDTVNDLIINYLLKDPQSYMALSFLPNYLEQAGQLDKLIAYLSPNNMMEMLKRSQSLSIVQQKTDLGLNTSLRLRRDGDLLRFGIQKSATVELDGAEVWRSEVQARIALDDYDSAIALAQTTILKEDRLHLLAIIAKQQREKGVSPEPELIEHIRQLYEEIDHKALGERAVDIAADLIHSNPDLAIELVEKASSTYSGENALDWAYAKLSIAAMGGSGQQPQPLKALESIYTRIKDPRARLFSTEASLLFHEFTASEVISEVEKLETTTDRLYLLRQWLKENREHNDAAEVTEYALKLSIKTTDYAPNSLVLRELATPLPFISNEAIAKRLIGIFDSQKVAIERLGPTEDYVRLQLLLAETEKKFSSDNALNRIIDVYFYCDEIKDFAIKAACIARLVSSLSSMDPEKKFENVDGIHSLTEQDLNNYVNILLSTTADHYSVTKGVIKALSQAKPKAAFDIAISLNLEVRRDMALLNFVRSYLKMPVTRLDLPFLIKVIEEFKDPEFRDIALVKTLERLSRSSKHINSLLPKALPLIDSIKDIQDLGERCRACCLAYSLLTEIEQHSYSSLSSYLLKLLKNGWDEIDDGWRKVDIGFKITEALAKSSPDIAKTYLELTEKYRDKIALDSHATAFTYYATLLLAIRAFSGLMKRNVDSKEDIGEITELINRIPSSGTRAELWAELALQYFINERFQDCKRIVTEHVKPLLKNISKIDIQYRSFLTINLAPALYCVHKLTAFDWVTQLGLPERDEAYMKICEFIIYKISPLDPYDDMPHKGFRITFEEVLDLCEILDRIDNDSIICHVMERICCSIAFNRKTLSQQQILDISQRLQDIIVKKLPNLRNIKHEGYRIVAQAYVYRILKKPIQDWLDLIESARNIPNVADQAFVLSIIAVSMPSKEKNRQIQLLEEAGEIIHKIPALYDRVEHYEMLARMALEVDISISKEYLKTAMQIALESKDSDLQGVERRIIDLAYRLDPDLASSLASLADDDEARLEVRKNLKGRIELLKLKNGIIDNETPFDIHSKSTKTNLPNASWMLLGALNSGRVPHIHMERTRDFIQLAATMPITHSYPIFAWVIQNAVKRFNNTDQALTILRPLFESIVLGTQLIGGMADRSSTILKRTTQRTTNLNTGFTLIRSNEREQAIEVIRTWLQKEVQGYLKICDPYFGPDDLELLQLVSSVSNNCRVQILTSMKHHKKEGFKEPWKEVYINHWRLHISDQDPPDTEIIIVGTKSQGESPIHDRWLLTSGRGLRLGTSFNSLGVDKSSEISVLTEEQTRIYESEIDQYLQRTTREHKGDKLQYEMFTL